jgi:hypothetical protein
MERRYDDILTARLEDAIYNGCTHITWNELYLWFNVQKIAAGTYRDLNERLAELATSKSPKPMMVEGRGGIYVFDGAKAKRIDPDIEK